MRSLMWRSFLAKAVISCFFIGLLSILFHNYFGTTDNDPVQYERQIQLDLARQWPGFGDNGVAVELFGAERLRGDKDLAKVGLNEALSERISYSRTVPDVRHSLCQIRNYQDSLPTVSVIIVFLNETYSVLLRTVHSVLKTSSKNLKEVILVDDGNTKEELGGKLQHYIKTRLPKMVKLITLERR